MTLIHLDQMRFLFLCLRKNKKNKKKSFGNVVEAESSSKSLADAIKLFTARAIPEIQSRGKREKEDHQRPKLSFLDTFCFRNSNR
jgi:hypothetical protein